jgi:type 1 glutamine amidotransferase
MHPKPLTRRAMIVRSAQGLGTLALGPSLARSAPAATDSTRVLIVVGPSSHPPGTHEVTAGGRLMQHALQRLANVPGIDADVFHDWPQDAAVRNRASTVVFIGDIFPPQRLPDSPLVLAQLGEMMKRGCGLACVHFATGLRAVDVPPDGSHPLLYWLGGYFATRCPHHQSVARVFPMVTITPAAERHPVSRGWRAFSLPEEPYYNNYFGPEANRLAPNVTALATSQLPPEAPQREVVAWGVERPDSGRGFAVVMPHFYKNWANDDLRRLILNGIVWTAKREVPAGGVDSAAPDLLAFQPESIEPRPRTPAAKKSATAG